jgi:glycosyltransferase involved in cell wall biosynthesis
VIYEGVDQSIVRKQAKKNVLPYFLYVGNAYPHKNLKVAVEAIVKLNQLVKKDIKLVLVTPKSVFSERLSALVIASHAEKYIEVKGKVSDEELSELYSNAQAFVFPSLSEGFGLPALESMSVGTPAIVSDIAVFHEIYKDEAIYFDPMSIDSFVSAMQHVLSLSLTKRTELSKRLVQFSRKYSWRNMARDTLALYANR